MMMALTVVAAAIATERSRKCDLDSGAVDFVENDVSAVLHATAFECPINHFVIQQSYSSLPLPYSLVVAAPSYSDLSFCKGLERYKIELITRTHQSLVDRGFTFQLRLEVSPEGQLKIGGTDTLNNMLKISSSFDI